MIKKDSSIIPSLIDDFYQEFINLEEYKNLERTEVWKKYVEKFRELGAQGNFEKIFDTPEYENLKNSEEHKKFEEKILPIISKEALSLATDSTLNVGGAIVSTKGLTKLQGADYVKRVSNAITEAVNSVKKVERNPNNRFKKKPLIPNPQFHDTRDFKEFFGKHFATGEGDIILDFFSGSATTAHAVMDLNAEDGGNRKYIMVQSPEQCSRDSEAYKAGYRTLAELGAERIRRAGKKIKEDTGKDIDYGFKYFRVSSPNKKDVCFNPLMSDEEKEKYLNGDKFKEDRTDEDLLYDTFIKAGIQLDKKVQKRTVNGRNYFIVINASIKWDEIKALCTDENEAVGDSFEFCFHNEKRQKEIKYITRDKYNEYFANLILNNIYIFIYEKNVSNIVWEKLAKHQPAKIYTIERSLKLLGAEKVKEIVKGISPKTEILVM